MSGQSDTLPPESDTFFWGAITLGLWFKARRERTKVADPQTEDVRDD